MSSTLCHPARAGSRCPRRSRTRSCSARSACRRSSSSSSRRRRLPPLLQATQVCSSTVSCSLHAHAAHARAMRAHAAPRDALSPELSSLQPTHQEHIKDGSRSSGSSSSRACMWLGGAAPPLLAARWRCPRAWLVSGRVCWGPGCAWQLTCGPAASRQPRACNRKTERTRARSLPGPAARQPVPAVGRGGRGGSAGGGGGARHAGRLGGAGAEQRAPGGGAAQPGGRPALLWAEACALHPWNQLQARGAATGRSSSSRPIKNLPNHPNNLPLLPRWVCSRWASRCVCGRGSRRSSCCAPPPARPRQWCGPQRARRCTWHPMCEVRRMTGRVGGGLTGIMQCGSTG